MIGKAGLPDMMMTELTRAIKEQCRATIEELIQGKADVNEMDGNGDRLVKLRL